MQKFISPAIEEEAVKVAVQLGRFCDNLSSSEATEAEAISVVKEIFKLYAHIGMYLKPPIIGGPNGHIKLEENQKSVTEEILYGLKWVLETDLLFPTFILTINSKLRGRKVSPDISEAIPNLNEITRQKLYVLVATCTSRTGIFTAPISLGLKAILSRACELTDQSKDYTTPLSQIDSNFAHYALSFIKSISNFKEINPIQRCLIPSGYKLKYIILFLHNEIFFIKTTPHKINDQTKKRKNNI